MKKLFLASVAFVILAAPAMAADLGRPAPAPVYKTPVVAPGYNWSGFYIGGSAGYGWGNSSTTDTATGVTSFSTSQSMNSWVAGFETGYNWQFGQSWVFGAELDAQATGQDSTVTIPSPALGGTFEQKLPFFGTARLRLGVLPMDRWMIYATGGLAYGVVDTNIFVNTTASTSSSSITHAGWTVGGGTEWAVAGAWTAKVEYLYVDLGTISTTGTGPGPAIGPTLYTGSHVTDNIVRVGVNYRFGGAPVVAGY